MVCTRERIWNSTYPVRSVQFHPQKWRTLVNHGHCEGISNTAKWFSRYASKFVPGTARCEKAFLTIRYSPRADVNKELDQSPNCLYSPPNGFVCSDWSSPTISKDLTQARRTAAFNTTTNYTDTHMRNPVYLRIWDRALQGSTTDELLSRYVLGPCVSTIVSDLQALVSHHQMKADEAVVIQSLVLLRNCGSGIPLTSFRLQLLNEALNYFKSKTSSSKSKLLIELMFKRFKSQIKLVDGKVEERRAALGISLLLSQLKVFSHSSLRITRSSNHFAI